MGVTLDEIDRLTLGFLQALAVTGPEGGIYKRNEDWYTADLISRMYRSQLMDVSVMKVARSLGRLAAQGKAQRRYDSGASRYCAIELPPEFEAKIGQRVPTGLLRR